MHDRESEPTAGDGLPDDIAEIIRGDPDPTRAPSLHERFEREKMRRGPPFPDVPTEEDEPEPGA